MPLGSARGFVASAFTSAPGAAFQPVNNHASSTSTSTGTTTTGTMSGGSTRDQRSKRMNVGVNNQMSGVGKGRGASGAKGGRNSTTPHVPYGNTALSVKADEARLNTIQDEKERKRLKRLLRNRVSAQQARERKKAYLASLEQDESEKVNRMAELENRVNALERENQMLRQVIQTVTRRAVPANARDYAVPTM